MRKEKAEKISFYVPVLNAEKYLKSCISSIIAQEYPIYEIIIIDNGSTDSSLRIANSFRKELRNRLRFRVLKEKKIGLANVRNTALRFAKGDFIASIDADCRIEKNWLSLTMRHFNGKRALKIAGVGGKLVENSTWRAIHLKQEWGDKRIINPPFLFGADSVFKADALKKIGGYDARFKSNYEDVNISKRLMRENFILIYEPEALAFHMKKERLFQILKSAWAWGFYGNEPTNFIDIIRRIAFNIKRPFDLAVEDINYMRPGLLLVDLLMLLSNPFFDVKYYIFYLKKKYF